MDNKPSSPIQVFYSLVCLSALFVLSLLLFSFIARFLIIETLGVDVLNIDYDFSSNAASSKTRYALLTFQAFSTGVGGFLVPVFLWLVWFEKFKISGIELDGKLNKVHLVLSTCVIAWVLVFMPFNSLLIHMNSKIEFPQTFAEFENSLKSMENNAETTTEFLTDFDSPLQFLYGFLVIAVLTGIGEEVFFRRAIQKKIQDSGYNHHFAIWMAAAVFSFVHFQFFGFIPRLILGAAFGYVYYWTGNLVYPILAHITNNGFTLIVIYYYKQKGDKIDFSDKEMAEWHWILVSFIGSLALIYYIWKISTEQRTSNDEERDRY